MADRPVNWFIAPPGYRRHRPEATLLYQLVGRALSGFRDPRAADRRSLPRHVEKEFEAYLKCGRALQTEFETRKSRKKGNRRRKHLAPKNIRGAQCHNESPSQKKLLKGNFRKALAQLKCRTSTVTHISKAKGDVTVMFNMPEIRLLWENWLQ